MDKDRETAKEEAKQLGFGAKIAYFFRYYWGRIAAVAVALVIGISLLGHFTWNKGKKSCLGVAVHAAYYDPDLFDTFASDLTDAFPTLTENGKKEVKAYAFYNGYGTGEEEEAYTTKYREAASVEAQMLDVVIGDLDSLTEDVESGYLISLDQLFTDEEMEEIQKKAEENASEKAEGVVSLKYTISNDQGRTSQVVDKAPYLINITGTNDLIDRELIGKEVYIGVYYNGPCQEQAKEFILRLLDIDVDSQGSRG